MTTTRFEFDEFMKTLSTSSRNVLIHDLDTKQSDNNNKQMRWCPGWSEHLPHPLLVWQSGWPQHHHHRHLQANPICISVYAIFFNTLAQPQAWMPSSSTNYGRLTSTSTTQGQAENLCQQFFIMPRTLKILWRAHGEDFGWRRRKREPRFIQGGFCLSALSLLSVLSVLLVLSHPEEAVLYSRWQSPWSWICRWPAQWMYPTSPSTRTLASSSSPALAGGRF